MVVTQKQNTRTESSLKGRRKQKLKRGSTMWCPREGRSRNPPSKKLSLSPPPSPP